MRFCFYHDATIHVSILSLVINMFCVGFDEKCEPLVNVGMGPRRILCVVGLDNLVLPHVLKSVFNLSSFNLVFVICS